MSLMGFKDGETVVDMTDLDAIQIVKNNDQWDIAVHLFSSEKGRRSYCIYRSEDHSKVLRYFDSLLREFPDVKML